MKRKGFEGYEFIGSFNDPKSESQGCIFEINIYYKYDNGVHKYKQRYKFADEMEIDEKPIIETDGIISITCN